MLDASAGIWDGSGRLGSIAIPWRNIIMSFVLLYPIVCSFFRYQRRDSLIRSFPYPTRASLSRMTNDHAHAILSIAAELEFPYIYRTSLQFALFKTYGIPTISKLLVSTRELSNEKTSSKRLADTSVLIGEFIAHAPTTERSIKAIARMNYIHSLYQNSGKILQDDLLYTLSLFLLEPIRWINAKEWRNLTEIEVCAMATFWKSIGDSMGIEYRKLKRSHSGWRDGIEFIEDIEEWANAYEEVHMVPAISNRKTADETTALLLFHVPSKQKPFGRKVVSALMEDHLRTAMMYDTPPKGYFTFVKYVFAFRKCVLRYLSLPRPSFMAVRDFSPSADPKTGRYHYNDYTAHPFYNKPSFLNRWGPGAWMVWALGGDVPGTKGDLYIPQGYRFEEVGPQSMKNQGLEFTNAVEKRLRKERTGGCPFASAG